jgi:gliding motility-associated-like protein
MQYVVHVSVDINGNTCTASNKVNVTVIPNYDVYIPNAFTPDGNGVNDVFEMFGNKKALQYLDVKIFNRIGEKVFESNDIDFKWDGTYKGVLQQPGVYVYTINTVFIDGERKEIYKGGITLIR